MHRDDPGSRVPLPHLLKGLVAKSRPKESGNNGHNVGVLLLLVLLLLLLLLLLLMVMLLLGIDGGVLVMLG